MERVAVFASYKHFYALNITRSLLLFSIVLLVFCSHSGAYSSFVLCVRFWTSLFFLYKTQNVCLCSNVSAMFAYFSMFLNGFIFTFEWQKRVSVKYVHIHTRTHTQHFKLFLFILFSLPCFIFFFHSHLVAHSFSFGLILPLFFPQSNDLS